MKKRIFCFILFLVFSGVVAESGFSYSHGISNIKGEVSPEISNIKVYPSSGTHGTVISITFEIDDPQGFDNIRKELFQIREGVEPILLKLFNDGAHGDAQANDNVYSAETIVPKTAAKGAHEFHVFVLDKDGNKSNDLTYKFTVSEMLEV
tara:strand:- start:34 stop:483 length:450 start_codon:yes stop_codon:yes gene_type:complete